MPKAMRERNMAVSREALRGAILDFEKYPEFLPEVKAAKRKPGGTPERTLVEFELEVIKRFQYTLEFDFSSEDEIRWKLVVPGFFKKNDGAWKLKESGKTTQVQYELDVEVGFMVPGWVTKKLTETNLPKLLESFEAQAKKTGGKK